MLNKVGIFFQQLARHTRESFKNIGRNFGLSLSAISAITITLLVTSVFLMLLTNINHFTQLAKDEVTMYVQVKKDVDEAGVAALKQQIEQIPNVREVEYSSKEQELDLLIEEEKDNAEIFEQYRGESNPLFDVFIISVKDVEHITETANQINTIEGIYDVKLLEDLVEDILGAFKVVNQVSVVLIIALLLVTSFLIANTIKIAIFSRRKEVEIMKLVGASNFFIRTPFIFEGFLIGILGAIIPIGITIYGYYSLYTHFATGLGSYSTFIQLIPPFPFVIYVSLILLVIGVLVGMWGSGRAVRKFLKI